jgi:hypothetical protein
VRKGGVGAPRAQYVRGPIGLLQQAAELGVGAERSERRLEAGAAGDDGLGGLLECAPADGRQEVTAGEDAGGAQRAGRREWRKVERRAGAFPSLLLLRRGGAGRRVFAVARRRRRRRRRRGRPREERVRADLLGPAVWLEFEENRGAPVPVINFILGSGWY